MGGGEDTFELALRFGRNLRCMRRIVDLSQEQLAERADLHRTEIGLLESGQRLPRLDTIIKIAGGTEAAPADLLDGLSWFPGSTGPGGQFYVADESRRAVRDTGRFDR